MKREVMHIVQLHCQMNFYLKLHDTFMRIRRLGVILSGNVGCLLASLNYCVTVGSVVERMICVLSNRPVSKLITACDTAVY